MFYTSPLKRFFHLILFSYLSLQGVVVGSDPEHIEPPQNLSADPKRNDKAVKTSMACWHYQLMQIHDHMINEPELVSSQVLERDKKKYKNNNSIKPFAEMMKGSRMEVFETESACDLVIAFRGTYQNALTVDLLQDLNFIPTTGNPDFHPGFFDAAKSYEPVIKKVLNEAKKKCGASELAITVTGHSLGGAIAYAVVNVIEGLDLGKPELVLFGSPRVVRHPSKHTDRTKATHYYIDRDPVVLTPPAIMFRELTDNMYRFNRVPVTEPVSVTGHQLFQNHLPSVYIKKMRRWCENKEIPKKVSVFSHTLRDSGFDATKRVVRSGVDAAGDALLPNKNEKGGSLPPVSEGVITYFTSPDNSKGNPEIRNLGDGKSYATNLACKVSHFWGSKTKAGRNYYCKKTVGFNVAAKEACETACEIKKLKPGGCLEGCYNHFHQFCIGNWACPGDPLGG